MTAKALVVDDEPAIVEIVAYNLEAAGFEVETAGDGDAAVAAARRSPPDVVVLDLMLPGMDGLAVCRTLRQDPATKDCRVVMLTAKSEEADEIVGFHSGADDYVTKPFRVRPLVERVKALVRRPGEAAAPSKDRAAGSGIEVDRVAHAATLDGEDLPVTPTEFRLLWTFLRQPRRTFNRGELMDCCRGEDANSLERTIDVHIRSLRKKLGDRSDVIETVRGVGYRYRPAS